MLSFKKISIKVLKIIGKVFMAILTGFVKILDDLLLIIGMGLLSYGVFMFSIPAGYIALGICFMAFAYLIAKRR